MTSYWKNTVINFGNIKKNRSKEIVFEALPNIPTISNIIPGCGCTKVSFDPVERKLKVIYNSGEIPKQVAGDQVVSKSIQIVYADRTAETLFIKGIKTRE
jgi:hypothetical protein